MKRTVFISHSSDDRQIAERLCAYLEQHAVPCWIAPRDVTPGKNYGAAIIDAIDECRVFVLILSSRSNKSRQVVREVERAASTDSVILPFRIEDVQPSRDIAFYVSAAHWLDAAKYPVEEQFDELLAAIQNWQKSESAIDSSAPLPTPWPPGPPAPVLPPKRAVPLWPFIAGAAGTILLIGAWEFFQSRTAVRPSTNTPAASEAPASSPAASAEPAITPANAFVSEPPIPTAAEAAPETPIVSTTATPVRLKPGERLRQTATPESAVPSVTPPKLASLSTPAANAAALTTRPKPIVREVAASSQLNEEFRPNFAFDGNPTTAWVAKGRGTEQSLFVHFKSPALIESVSILNGDARDEEHFRASNRIRTLRIVLSDGSNQLLTLKDEMKMQRFSLTKPTTADWAKFEIVSVFPGKTKRTGIAEIAFNEPEQ